MESPKIHCLYTDLLDPKKLKDHPKNRNKHEEAQVLHLSRLYLHHGIRHPIIISNLSKCIVAGHGRKLAAIEAKLDKFPVVYQDFESKEAEYAFIQADNAIALQAELDVAGIKEDLAEFGPDFDVDSLGIADFDITASEEEFPELDSKDPDFQQRTFVLSNEQNDILDEALAKAQKEEDCSDEINPNKNGNALIAALKRYVHG